MMVTSCHISLVTLAALPHSATLSSCHYPPCHSITVVGENKIPSSWVTWIMIMIIKHIVIILTDDDDDYDDDDDDAYDCDNHYDVDVPQYVGQYLRP